MYFICVHAAAGLTCRRPTISHGDGDDDGIIIAAGYLRDSMRIPYGEYFQVKSIPNTE